MSRTRALLGVGSLLVATTVSATLLGGCTMPNSGASPSAMAQPAPRARLTGGVTGYTPVTDQRLVSPEPENWLMYRRTYDGWGYSPLEQITTGNVKSLVPVWTFSTGVVEGHQAPPIVNNGIMFVSTPQNQVLALEAKSGELLWRYKRELPEELFQLHPTNRGVALYEDKVYLATLDAHVIALDAKTGKLLWDQTVEDYKKGYYMTLAPLVARGKVMVGVSGGELGVRGFVQAFDARTGQPAWKTFTIPAPGEPGSETWKGDAWKTGGAAVWITGSYDPQLNLTYWGTGNAAQWMGDQRPGDNLYSTSVIALDADSGRLRGYHQYHWNDSWDWDEVSAPILMDVQRGGRTVKSLVHPARNGYLWVLERRADAIGFLDAKPYVKQTAFTRIDPRTGRPEYDESKKPVTGKKVPFCPSLWGGKDWPPAAYNPKTGLLYIPANENLCGSLLGATQPFEPGKLWLGTEIKDILMTLTDGSKHIGEIQAWDMNAGKKVWTRTFESHNWGPILTTGSGLVFAGGTNDRYFSAFDGKTGEPLWQWRTNSGITAVPSSFAVDGVQYVAVQSGWGVDAQRMQDKLDEIHGEKTHVPQGGVIWVFALKR
jgi:alcohol dehydrogenase (cytochrome c)